MALNVARQLHFHRGFVHSRYHGTQQFRHFGNTTQKRTVDEVLGEGIENPKGMRVLSHAERLGMVETEVANIKGSIDDGFKRVDDGFKRVEGWIKTIVTFGVGTVIFGFGTLAYKVMVYDIATNKEMKAHIETVVTASEQKNKVELDYLKFAMELTTQRQIGEVVKEIRSVVRDEVHHYMRAGDGEK